LARDLVRSKAREAVKERWKEGFSSACGLLGSDWLIDHGTGPLVEKHESGKPGGWGKRWPNGGGLVKAGGFKVQLQRI